MAFAVEFLPVGDSDGDAILIQYGTENGWCLNIVDGGYASIGEKVVVAHRTALEIQRPDYMSWPAFTSAIRGELQPRRGSVMISSEATGRTFLCSNAGNQPGRFQRL